MKSSPQFNFANRSSGVLLHITSLPGPHGSGDLGPAAFAFADFLHDAGQTWWQMLPINPPGDPPGNSPYSSTSAFAGSAHLICLEHLLKDGLLTRRDLRSTPELKSDRLANFAASFAFRDARLRKAFAAFEAGGKFSALDRFTAQHKKWLDDYVLYAALRDAHQGKSWTDWPAPLRLRDPRAMREARKSLARDIRYQQFIQYIFDRQWTALRAYCHERGIGLIGDVPIFVAHDSADVWAHRDLFLLDADGRPRTVSGYPPDHFNKDGQTWGHPHYRWAAHRKEKFAWWTTRFAETLRQFDGVRIDHFLGFHRAWHVPAGAKHARRGKWVLSPGRKIFEALRRKIPNAQIIAEDLGKLTPQASALRDRFDFPGMRIMQFGFGFGGSYHLPHTFPRRCVAYTGTHDNSTIIGWFEELRTTTSIEKDHPRLPALRKLLRYVGSDGRHLNWDMIRVALASAADTVIFPAQDVIGLDDRSRMNVPGTAEGNWRWRLLDGELTAEHAARLRERVELYDRLPQNTIQ